MKRLSAWAKGDKKTARFLIVISFIVLNILGVFTGVLLGDLGIDMSYDIFLSFSIICLAALLIYPSRRLRKEKLTARAFYIRQKSCDALLVATTFCMIVFLGNRPEMLSNYFPAAHASVTTSHSLPKDSSAKAYKPVREFSAAMKDENGKLLKWKERKKLLKEQVRAIKKSTDMSNGGKAALIVLSVLVALGLVLLVASLACELSCSGSEAAAVLVGIGGTALIIFLLVITIRGILGKKRKKKPPVEEGARPD